MIYDNKFPYMLFKNGSFVIIVALSLTAAFEKKSKSRRTNRIRLSIVTKKSSDSSHVQNLSLRKWVTYGKIGPLSLGTSSNALCCHQIKLSQKDQNFLACLFLREAYLKNGHGGLKSFTKEILIFNKPFIQIILSTVTQFRVLRTNYEYIPLKKNGNTLSVQRNTTINYILPCTRYTMF